MTLTALVGIKHRFSGRILEWYLAVQLFALGMILLSPSDVFAGSANFAGFFISEDRLGWLLAVLGVVRLMALIVNGAVPNVTPLVRLCGAFIGCGVCFFVSWQFARGGHLGLWAAYSGLACFGEVVNVYRASQDASHSLARHKAMATQDATHGLSR